MTKRKANQTPKCEESQPPKAVETVSNEDLEQVGGGYWGGGNDWGYSSSSMTCGDYNTVYY